MLVKKSHVSVVLSLVLAGQLAMPSLAMAENRPYFEQKLKEQALAQQQVVLNPFDEATNALLADFGITLQPVDPLWQDPLFVEFVLTLQAAVAAEQAGDYAKTMTLAFTLLDLGKQIPNEQVQDSVSMTPEQEASFDVLRDLIEADPKGFEQNPEAVLEQWYAIMLEQVFVEYEEEYTSYLDQHPVQVAYPYSESWYTEPGRVSWLKVDTGSVQGISAEWTQVAGTPVTWLNTVSPTDRAFLTPNVGPDGEYLEFVAVVTDGKESFSTRVYVTVVAAQTQSANQDPISELYVNVLGRNPDSAGYDYWSAQYASGMSLEEIESHFRASAEYMNKTK